MIDLSQKARAGRTRAIVLLKRTGKNVFFDAPQGPSRNRRIVREKTDRLLAATLVPDLHLAV